MRETEDKKERVKNREKEGVAALSSFKTMCRGRLVWSLNGCHYPVSPLTWIHTQTYACENTRWHPFAHTIHSYRCCTWVTQMCFPRISPLYTPPSVRITPVRRKEDREAEQSALWKTQGENEKRGVLYWESKIGKEWKDTEHKRRRQSKGWASEPAMSSQQCKGGRKQKGGAGWLRLIDERGHRERSLIIHVWESL